MTQHIPQVKPLAIEVSEWLTPAECKRIFKLSNTKFWQLVANGYIKAYRPDPTPNSRLTRFRRSEVERLFLTGIKPEQLAKALSE